MMNIETPETASPDTQDPQLVLGTVALGLAYGVAASAAERSLPEEPEVQALLQLAAAGGIRCFDTAPSYGLAEERLGRFLPHREGEVWTKLSNLAVDEHLPKAAADSLALSFSRLHRDTIDCLQWHNWRAELAESPEFLGLWASLRKDARIKSLGASTYGIADALAAVRSGLFQQVQIEWNLLNQGVLNAVAAEASARRVRLVLRSIFLQGVLTSKGENLPPALAQLAEPRLAVKRIADRLGLELNALALRAALDHPARPWVLVGPDRAGQMREILEHSALPGLPENLWPELRDLDLGGGPLTDPRTWKI